MPHLLLASPPGPQAQLERPIVMEAMEAFEKWYNEQKDSVAWSLLGEESRLYQAWVCGAMHQYNYQKAREAEPASTPPNAEDNQKPTVKLTFTII